MTSTTPLLAVRGVRAAYGKIEALKGVDIEIKPGEIVALIGANGAGKSTLMMTIFGKPRARAGSIEYDGRDITGVPTHEIARLRIAQSPEGRASRNPARGAPPPRPPARPPPPPDWSACSRYSRG